MDRGVCRSAECEFASFKPVVDRRFNKTGFSKVVGHDFRLSHHNVRKLLFHCARNLSMQLMPAALEQTFVCRIPHQRMLKTIDSLRWLTTVEEKFSLLEFGESMPHRLFVASGHLAQQGIGELTPDSCSDLADRLYRRQAIEPRHQGVLKSRRNGKRGQGPVKPIGPGVPDQNVSFEHRLGELLDEQRVAVGLGDNLVHHFGWQGTAVGYLRSHAFNVAAVEATERQGADIGETNPGSLEFRSKSEQGKDR